MGTVQIERYLTKDLITQTSLSSHHQQYKAFCYKLDMCVRAMALKQNWHLKIPNSLKWLCTYAQLSIQYIFVSALNNITHVIIQSFIIIIVYKFRLEINLT